jgi:acyl-ACP thioesterase
VEEEAQVAGQAQVARRSDMDMNGHINNVVYLAWTLESLPDEVYDNYNLYEVRGRRRWRVGRKGEARRRGGRKGRNG